MRNRWVAVLLLMTATLARTQNYSLALPGYKFEFPHDYFNHEDYQTEWWYYTGNLNTPDGHRFGFELTFFRQGDSREPSSNPWFVHDVWMAHLALSDISGQRFYFEERLNRSGPGLAGVNAQTGQVWNGNWQAQIGEKQEDLRANGKDFSFNFRLVPTKPPVIQGQNGISQKAAGAGHASHYFSLTRLQTTGSIQIGGKSLPVQGTSWMDHEFFTGSMDADEVGWDWLSIQFRDGSELMLYRLRHRNGSIDPYSSGSFVNARGESRYLAASDFTMTPGQSRWTSPQTKASYPVNWHVSVPELKLELNVTTPLRDQELTSRFGPCYWEGAIDVSGTEAGSPIQGDGYLEMTGYAAGSGFPGRMGEAGQ